jgi:hypothetical protein
MIGDVAAATRLEHFDMARGQPVGGREDMPAAAIAANTERQHGRMLDEQKQIVDALLLALHDERALERMSVSVRDAAEPTNLEWAHIRQGHVLRPGPTFDCIG